MNSHGIKQFEYSTMRVGEQGFTERHFETLVKYNDTYQSRFFTVGNKKITFNSYVGVLQVGKLVIEILPKGDKSNDTSKWRNALLQMLKVARYANLHLGEKSMLNSSRNHLIELLFLSYIREVRYLVHSGVVKRYIRVSQNTYALKGKLCFNKHIQQNIIHKEIFFNEYSLYSRDNIYNQVLKAAALIISKVTVSLEVKALATGLLLDLDQVSDISPASIDFKRLILDRKTRDYQAALSLAELIIRNYSSDLQRGGLPLIAFLFDMNALFENFIYRSFKQVEQNFMHLKLSVLGQMRSKFWGNKEIRPDIILEYEIDGRKRRIIVDTKWKILSDLKPSDADLKQIYVYNMQLGSDRGILLYPDSGLVSFSQDYRKSVLLEEFDHTCSLSFISPFDEWGWMTNTFAGDYLQKILI